MFIYTLTEFENRPTRDMDFMLRYLSGELDNIQSVMTEICEVNTENEFVRLEVVKSERITLEKKYPGVKTKFVGYMNNVRVPFSVDVGIDDVIVPDAVVRRIATRLDGFEARKYIHIHLRVPYQKHLTQFFREWKQQAG